MRKSIEAGELWTLFDRERSRAWEGHENAEVGSPEWEIAAGKIEVINSLCHGVNMLPAAPRSDADNALRPVWKSGTGLVHSTMADGSGKFENRNWAAWTCPVCGGFVGERYIPPWAGAKPHNQRQSNFCSVCGQRIDWTETEKGEKTNE